MIKTIIYCDKCGAIITDSDKRFKTMCLCVDKFDESRESTDYSQGVSKDLCFDCTKELAEWFNE